ncbi:hypothetical protein [Acididesulfobacillus acetoxydans]|uniref:hypothetical protein n=1 Tax=Acididesulfobacillus acetoxydans TaxID=1561005 RepID=UPI001F10B758|nr:hypothetical protein [Acididesulfobacillus acetoxydans]
MGTLIFMNTHNTKEVNRIYASEASRELSWKENIYHIRQNRLEEKLEEKNIRGKDEIQLVLDRVYKEAENRKFSGLLSRGAFIGMAIPLWSGFLQAWFRIATTSQLLAVLFLRAMSITASICLLSAVFGSVVKEMLNLESARIKGVAEMIDEILLKELLQEQRDSSLNVVNSQHRE